MRVFSTLLLSMLCVSIPAQSTGQLDSFGGALDRPCIAATQYFHVENSNGQRMLCTPEGHSIFVIGVDAVFPPESRQGGQNEQLNRIVTKYGNSDANWAEATARRIQYWGFNTLGTYSSRFVEPTYLSDTYPEDTRGMHSHPTKLPFITLVRPAYYAMKSEPRYISEPVKNLMYAASPYYRGYSPSTGIADYYDAKLSAWLRADLATETYWTELGASPYLNYLIGIACEDGDEVYGFGAGDQFPTSPSRGFNNSHLSWIVATAAPTQSANGTTHTVYNDDVVYSKFAWVSFLKAKYHTIAALNASWGSSYTTFESSGMKVSDEYIATADGHTIKFSHLVARPLPSRHSVRFTVDGQLIAGDTNRDVNQTSELAGSKGQLFGANVQGQIDYSNGIAELTFATPPAPGSRITVSYIQNGWGIGSGLLDEDGRPQHQKWLGGDFVSLADARPAVRSDLSLFLKELSAQFFSSCKANIKTAFPHTLFLGPDTLGSYGVPPRAEVLQAASEYIDVLLLAGTGGFSQRVLDYIATYSGGKAIIEVDFRAANPDSELASYRMTSGVPGFSTQRDRGASYQRTLARLRNAANSQTFQAYVGLLWWQYADNWDEKLNWGLVTRFDNAYDGHEDTRQSVRCSAPLQAFNCGQESHDYGDLISQVREANLGLAPPPAEHQWNQLSLSLIGVAVLLSLGLGTARTYFAGRATSRHIV